MMKSIMRKLCGLAAALALVLAACTPLVEEMEAEYILLSVETLDFPADGGTKLVIVDTNVSTIDWGSAPSVSWCRPEIKDDGTLQVQMLANNDTAPRSVVVTLKGKTARATLTVTQAGKTDPVDPAEYITPSTQTLDFAANGDTTALTKYVTLTTNVSASNLTVDSNAEWCQATLESGKLKAVVAANPLAQQRQATVTLHGAGIAVPITVTQAAAEEYIVPGQPTLNFDYYLAGEKEAGTTSLDTITYTPAGSWCQMSVEDGRLKAQVSTNESSSSRSVMMNLYGSNTTTPLAVLTVTQAGKPAIDLPSTGSDVKLTVASAAVDKTALSGYGIEKSIDGNLGNTYFSSPNVFPITITYNFSSQGQMDYLRYYVLSGNNAGFRQIELWVNEGSGLVKYGDYNFNGSNAQISFGPPLQNPSQIQFKVLSGNGGYATCAEMEFYRKGAIDFDCLSIFTDLSCSAIKSGVTRSDIEAISDTFFKDLALKIFLGQYESEFRAQEYRAWENPDIKAGSNRSKPYSQRDNPTGIYVQNNEDLIVLVDNLHGQNVSVLSQDLSTGGRGTSRTYTLNMGFNKIRTTAKGLLYVQYYSNLNENAPKIKINFATGAVNGYFDTARHDSSDWQRLLNNAHTQAVDFDLVGERAHLTFPIAKFKTDTSDGAALVAAYDDLVRLEQEFMGLTDKHPERLYPNRMYFHLDYTTENHMYAQSYHTAYSVAGMDSGILKPSVFTTTATWGAAHEVGHMHQTDPNLTWAGMTEVTVNLFSMYVTRTWGQSSRLASYYTPAFAKLGGTTAHINIGSVWEQLVPFWQLKLYLVDVLGKEDFYKDLIYALMTTPSIGSKADVNNGLYQLDFVRKACDTAQLNLVYFFEQWGFLTPVSRTVSDYGTFTFNVTQEMIDSLKSEITAKGYANPPRDFTRITDADVDSYR
jgi:hypothetical protein